MNSPLATIIPITKARSTLGKIAKKVSGSNYIVLTRGGNPKAALVDIRYLTKLEGIVSKLYQKTFIDKKLLPYTRIFKDKEIKSWLKEDVL